MAKRQVEGPAPEERPTGEWPAAPGDGAAAGATVVRTLLRMAPVGAARELQELRGVISLHGGFEVEKGDATLYLFGRPSDAVAGALAWWAAGMAPVARAAIHLGEIRLRRPSAAEILGGAPALEVEGEARELAARLGALAGIGQILLTRGAFDLARQAAKQPAEASWLAHGEFVVEGVEEPLEIFEVGIPGRSPLAPPADSRLARRLLSPSEERMLGWRPAASLAIPRRPLWRLEQRLGVGGFGEVWLARHESGDTRVFKFCFEADKLRALKREVTLFRLLKEALGHRDDIARILDWNFDEPPFFLESEYTAGGSLPDWAARGEGLAALPLAARVALAAEVAEALGAAHSVGILHQDVKPENILIAEDRDGRPRALLADFGIGRLTEGHRLEEAGITRLGYTATLGEGETGAGSRLYRAPEMAAGGAASIQADLYSLGVVLYQLVVGDFHRPLAAGWQRDVPDPLLAEDLARLVDGHPESRPASATAVAQQLRTLEARRQAQARAAARELALEKALRRRRLAAAAATVGLVVVAVVAVMGLREFRARQAAEAAERRANQRQGQAEDLIDFMLGDLRKKLDGVGRLDVLDAVGEQAMDYFAAVPAAELSDTELARRSKALYQIGEVRTRQGQLPAARTAFSQSVRLAESLAARSPQGDEAYFELAQGYFWLGNVDWNQGDAASAREHFAAYLALAEQRAARAPESEKWQLEVAYALTSLAAVRESTGEEPAAEADLRRAIAIKEGLIQRQPGNREWRISLANGLAWLGAMVARRGRLAEAVTAFEAECEIRRQLVGEAPRDAAARSALAVALCILGQYQVDRGEVSEAAASLGDAANLLERLVAEDPANRRWQRDAAVALLQLAEVREFQGDFEVGGRLVTRAESLMSRLATLDPTNRDWQVQLAAVALRRADLEQRTGAPNKAIVLARRALVVLGPGATARIGEPERWHEGSGRRILARALAAAGKSAEARQVWQEIHATLAPQGVERTYAIFRQSWAETLLALDRRTEAAAEIAFLRTAGFRRPDFEELCARNGF